MSKRELYRDSKNGKLAGVCAGIADYFGWEVWLVRIVVISGLVLSTGFFFLAYLVAWFILEKKPANQQVHQASEYKDEVMSKHIEVKSRIWQAGESGADALHDMESKFELIEQRLRKLESYVTSSQFTVSREISRL